MRATAFKRFCRNKQKKKRKSQQTQAKFRPVLGLQDNQHFVRIVKWRSRHIIYCGIACYKFCEGGGGVCVWRGKRLRGEALRKNHQAFYVRFRKVHSEWNYENLYCCIVHLDITVYVHQLMHLFISHYKLCSGVAAVLPHHCIVYNDVFYRTF